jgi:hypothetical protein
VTKLCSKKKTQKMQKNLQKYEIQIEIGDQKWHPTGQKSAGMFLKP